MNNQIFTIGGNPKTTLTTYILDRIEGHENRPIVIVCPGGGFLDCSAYEGECVAMRFNSMGYHAAVLIYSTAASAPGNSGFPRPLKDLAESVRLLRAHAREWGIREDGIVILGFSAGGHLCGFYGNCWNGAILAQEGTPEQLRPNAAILCYPLTDYLLYREERKKTVQEEINLEKITGKQKNMKVREFWRQSDLAQFGKENPSDEELKKCSPIFYVNSDTPPTFIWTTFGDDALSPLQSLRYAEALYRTGIPCELHVYEKGKHGLSLADRTSAKKEAQIDPHVATWSILAGEWLNERFDEKN